MTKVVGEEILGDSLIMELVTTSLVFAVDTENRPQYTATCDSWADSKADFSEVTVPTAVERQVEEDRATGWIRTLPCDKDELAALRDDLQGSRAQMLNRVKALELPHVPFAHASVDEFVKDPRTLTQDLRGEKLFCTIQPANYAACVEAPKPSVISLSKITELAASYTTQATGVNYHIILSEARDIAYVGNIIVGERGDVYGEFSAEGIPPTRSGLKQVHRFQKDPFLGTFHYSFEDTALREAIYRSMDCLPHVGTCRGREWQQGYYELLLSRGADGQLRPEFYDYRDCKSFLYAPESKVL